LLPGCALLHPLRGEDHLGRSPGRFDAGTRSEDLPPGVDSPRPISVTFIPAKVFDNPALLQVNPEYLAWLLSLPLLERERLLGGNWKIRPAAGLYFKREWCAVSDAAPADLDIVRYWDLAATEKTEHNDPD
jgi:Terminase large subunit, T4likevirus-type, N-terminal